MPRGKITGRTSGKVVACIPATDANDEPLQRFGAGIDGMRKKLADYLKPGTILQTLANLGSIPMLATTPQSPGNQTA